ncbi:PiT family inorganic phosphate transporter [Silvimonas terrae]|uniref:Phosphate transporter n=1 Tax=Silvimonas terrae TaxID=300266 RepID=A0A840RIM3_9NEIS|nr:inorganic phosphate transporter [Silvimonas terrae]MBB5192957.1 PiT family inorganic phosphate transporter [Silvimonas terrae]
MSDATTADSALSASNSRLQLEKKNGPFAALLFLVLLVAGLAFTTFSLVNDIDTASTPQSSWLPYGLLGLAMLIALGFEFVNGFHDTANAVATVIYTNTLPATFAVVWSGFFNFLGVLLSSGAVAFGIISLLPVELILHVGSNAGFAMVFALLLASIIWNLGTWALGLPASSSHTLIGSIIGVGIANQLMAAGNTHTSGVDWGQALNVGKSLLLSPIIGFICAALLLVVLKALVKVPALYKEPKPGKAPPWWIRGLLVLTCTGVSFAHGSNDGQKGMGLIMLILIGILPTTYALNRAMPEKDVLTFQAVSQQASHTLARYATGNAPADFRAEVEKYVQSHQLQPQTMAAVTTLSDTVSEQIGHYDNLQQVPHAVIQNVRNDMYLNSEALRILLKDEHSGLNDTDKAVLGNYRKSLDGATKFIPNWVKIAVAIALGLGTLVGWKRIVVTVGEKIGKTHLTYAQGASAELVAMATIGAADAYGLPVSTTHVLSSGIAGTMAANKSGLQMSTVRNLVMAWVLTLPAAMLLSGTLYWVFSQFTH